MNENGNDAGMMHVIASYLMGKLSHVSVLTGFKFHLFDNAKERSTDHRTTFAKPRVHCDYKSRRRQFVVVYIV